MKDNEAITRVQRGVTRLGLDWADIVGPIRKRRFTDARKMVSYFLREQGWTFSDIGDVMQRDHATAMHHTRTFFHLMEFEEDTRRRYIDFCSA